MSELEQVRRPADLVRKRDAPVVARPAAQAVRGPSNAVDAVEWEHKDPTVLQARLKGLSARGGVAGAVKIPAHQEGHTRYKVFLLEPRTPWWRTRKALLAYAGVAVAALVGWLLYLLVMAVVAAVAAAVAWLAVWWPALLVGFLALTWLTGGRTITVVTKVTTSWW